MMEIILFAILAAGEVVCFVTLAVTMSAVKRNVEAINKITNAWNACVVTCWKCDRLMFISEAASIEIRDGGNSYLCRDCDRRK